MSILQPLTTILPTVVEELPGAKVHVVSSENKELVCRSGVYVVGRIESMQKTKMHR